MVVLFGLSTGRLVAGKLKTAEAKVELGGISLTSSVKDVTSNYYNGNGLFCDGSITVKASGGTGPYRFLLKGWYENVNGYFPTLPPGTYEVVVTDEIGVSDSVAVSVGSKYPIPQLEIANTKVPSSCTSQDGQFELTAKGGTPPYQYSIDGGVTFSPLNVFSGMRSGVYFCLVKDANNMFGETETSSGLFGTSIFFNCNCCQFSVFASGYGISTCEAGSAELTVRATGGVRPISYSLDNVTFFQGLTNSSDASDGYYTFTDLKPGLYQVYAKDSLGNIVSTTTSIARYCPISLSHFEVSASCGNADGQIILHPSNGAPPYRFTLDGEDYVTDSVFKNLAPGAYTITVIDANSQSKSINAVVFDKCPKVILSEINDRCSSGVGSIKAIGIDGTKPYLFSIDGKPFDTTNIFSLVRAGSHTITIMDALGFSSSDSIFVGNDCLRFTADKRDENCGHKNGKLVITVVVGNGPFQYAINDGTFQDGNSFQNLAGGKYLIKVRDYKGFVTTDSIAILNTSSPIFSVKAIQPSCKINTGSIQFVAGQLDQGYLYSINGGKNFSASDTYSGVDSGLYHLIVKDSVGCSTDDSVLLNVPDRPNFELGPDTVLCGHMGFRIGTRLVTTWTYLWQNGSIDNYIYASKSGEYSLTVVSKDGCSYTDSIQLTFKEEPVFSLGSDTGFCPGRSIHLTPVLPNGIYSWNTGETTSSIAVSKEGKYWLSVAIDNCKSTDTVIISALDSPHIDLPRDTAICLGAQLELNAYQIGSSYLWQDGSTSPKFVVTAPGNYSVSVQNHGCVASASVSVRQLNIPKVNFPHDSAVCVGTTVLLDAQYPGSTYRWQNGSTSSKFYADKPGLYTVTVKNICGSVDANCIIVSVKCNCNWNLPNAFSPNNDGRNDVFRAVNNCNEQLRRFVIFNRWGQRIFETTDKNVGWDGTSKGQPQPVGQYVWAIEVKDTDGSFVWRKGSFLLLR